MIGQGAFRSPSTFNLTQFSMFFAGGVPYTMSRGNEG
jgi:hypothetical protein